MLFTAAAVVEGRSAVRKQNPFLTSSLGELENIEREKKLIWSVVGKKSMLMRTLKALQLRFYTMRLDGNILALCKGPQKTLRDTSLSPGFSNLLVWCRASFCGQYSVSSSWE